MTFLTQRNATVWFGLNFAWVSLVAAGTIPHAQWSDTISNVFNGGSIFLGYMGFNRTPAGNTIAPAIANVIDRQAVVAKAGDAVIEAAAAVVVADAQSAKTEAGKK